MKKILYWSDDYKPQDLMGNRRAGEHLIIEFLKTFDRRIRYKGSANCRICGEKLGSSCYIKDGFMWPEKAEHYITHHHVRIPELDEILLCKSVKTKTLKLFETIASYWGITKEELAQKIVDSRVRTPLYVPVTVEQFFNYDSYHLIHWFLYACDNNPENSRCPDCSQLNLMFDDCGYFAGTTPGVASCCRRSPLSGGGER